LNGKWERGPANRAEDKAMKENKAKLRIKLFSRSDTQPSLFHYVKETPDPSVFEGMDWNFLLHPIDSFIQAWKSPRTKPSLFHYFEEQEQKTPFSLKEFFKDLVTGFRNPLFIPSVFSDPQSLAIERSQGRTRKWEAGGISVIIHAAIIASFVLFAISRENAAPVEKKDVVIIVNNDPMPIVELEKEVPKDEGGGGGGGKGEKAPAATGRLPQSARIQTIPPSPGDPQPLLPAEELFAQVQTVQIPVDLPMDMRMPIGVFGPPPNGSLSSGTGKGGGIGDGEGTGVGSGQGPGAGPGKNGGIGGGALGGVAGPKNMNEPGMKKPELLVMIRPLYTEQARKERIQGVVSLKAIIRANGTVDVVRVARGLGYGLDEQAINTVAAKWRFKPATQHGVPVDFDATIEVEFTIH